MVVLACESKIKRHCTTRLRLSAIGVVGVLSLDYGIGVCHFPDAAQMIPCIVVVAPVQSHPLSKVSTDLDVVGPGHNRCLGTEGIADATGDERCAAADGHRRRLAETSRDG